MAGYRLQKVRQRHVIHMGRRPEARTVHFPHSSLTRPTQALYQSEGRYASSLEELGLAPLPPHLAQRPIVQCTEVVMFLMHFFSCNPP